MADFFDIGTLGTSLTAGSGAAESYHRSLECALRPGKQSIIRSYNMGVAGGQTDPHGFANYPIVGKLRPKVILIEFSMNDLFKGVTQARADMRTLLSGLQATSPTTKLFLMTMNTVVGSSSSATSRAAVNTYYQIYRDEVVLQPAVGLIDTYPAWSGATLTDIPDGVHPTVAANTARLIPAIVAVLGPLIT